MRTIPRGQIEEMIEYLATTYPKAFFTSPHLKRPLKKNILLDLERDRVLDDEKREAAVKFYTRDWNYEATLVAGAKRIDLNGKEVGTVTQLEQVEAGKRIQAGKELQREKLKAQGPVEVVRKLHADGKIVTNQLSKISAPPLARAPMAKAKTPEPVPMNGIDLTKLHKLLDSIDDVVAKTDEDATLQSMVTAAGLKVLVHEANKLITKLEEKNNEPA